MTRYIEDHGVAFFHLTQQQELEGIVAKRKDSLYFFDKRTKDWIKCKNLLDDDFVVCGYIPKSNHVTSIVLGQYNRQGEMVYKGHVTLGLSNRDFQRIAALPTISDPPFAASIPASNERAIWLEASLVCVVQYMMKTAGGGLRQPVFKGLRGDKAPHECFTK